MTHFEHLCALIPGLPQKKILDIGSGEGAFAVEAARAGAEVTAVEYYPVHIEIAERRMREAGVSVSFTQGAAEKLPFADASFDFINMSEVVEHVQDPAAALAEAYRVLRPGGIAYVSAPNRFGMRDPHYHLWFVNWMPRAWAEAVITALGKRKDAVEYLKGNNDLSTMHYYRYGVILALVRASGFEAVDIRTMRIRAEYPAYVQPFAMTAYFFLRAGYYDSFHLLLRKRAAPDSIG